MTAIDTGDVSQSINAENLYFLVKRELPLSFNNENCIALLVIAKGC